MVGGPRGRNHDARRSLADRPAAGGSTEMGRGARFVNRPAREGRQARTIARVHCADVGRVDPSLRGLTAAGAGVVGRVRPGSAWAVRSKAKRWARWCSEGRAAGRRCAAPRAGMAGAGQLGRENASSTCRYTNGPRPLRLTTAAFTM